MSTVQELQQIPLLADLEPVVLEKLAAICEETAVDANTWIIREGEKAEALYLIRQGRVELKLKLDAARETYVTLNILGDRRTLGWSALVEPYIYKLSAVATARTELLRLDHDRLSAILDEHPESGYHLMQHISEAMSDRLTLLSEKVPELSVQGEMLAAVLDLGILVAGVVAIFAAVLIIYSLAIDESSAVPVFIFCIIVPGLFLAWALNFRHSLHAADHG